MTGASLTACPERSEGMTGDDPRTPLRQTKKTPPRRGSLQVPRRSGYFLAADSIEATSIVIFSLSALPLTVTSWPAILPASS